MDDDKEICYRKPYPEQQKPPKHLNQTTMKVINTLRVLL